MTEAEFYADKDAAAAAQKFFKSNHGQKFLTMCKTLDPINVLATKLHHQQDKVRDIALAQQGSADLLLGISTGFRLVLNIMDAEHEYIPAPSKPKEPASMKIAKSLRRGGE